MELTAGVQEAERILRYGTFAEWVSEGAPPDSPGVVLFALIRKAGFSSLRSFAEAAGINTGQLTLLIQNKRPISANMALRIGRALDVGPNIIAELQTDWDLWLEQQKKETL